jgi:predicted esterase YcpF (UPF0227 family)
MSETYEARAQRRLKAEIDQFEADERAQLQQQLDCWWQSRRDEAAEYRKMMRELNPVGLIIWD